MRKICNVLLLIKQHLAYNRSIVKGVLDMKEAKPITNIVLKHNEKQSLEEFAVVLESIAKKLKEKGDFTFTQGEKAISIAPGKMVKAEFEYTTKGNKHSFEIEFDWYEGEGVEEIKSMSIE